MNKTSKRDIDPSIGLRIRKRRESFAYSREKLAELAEISTSFLADVELGNRTCSYLVLMKICKVLGASSDYLLFGNTNDPESYDSVVDLLSCLDIQYLPYVESLITTFVKSIFLAENDKKEE